MKKIKILAMLVAAMFGAVTVAGAADLETSIDVEVKDWIGVAYPAINAVNQSIQLNVTREKNETGVYTGNNYVNESLVIQLSVVETDERDYLLPRVMFYMVFINKEEGTLMERLMPMFSFGSANLVSSIVKPDVDTNITIPLSYAVHNDTFADPTGENSDQLENLTVKILAIGFLPGTVNGFIEEIPVIAKGEFTIYDITYVDESL